MFRDMKKIIYLIVAMMSYNVLLSITPTVSEPCRGLVRIDMERVACKVDQVKKRAALLVKRRKLLVLVGVPIAAYVGMQLWKAHTAVQPEVEKKVLKEKPERNFDQERFDAWQESKTFTGRLQDRFYDVLVLVLVSMIFDRMLGTAGMLCDKLSGCLVMNTPAIKQLSDEMIEQWKQLCGALANYSGQSQAFSGALTKNKGLAVFVSSDVYTAYGRLMYTIEKTMALTLVKLSGSDATGSSVHACTDAFGSVSDSLNKCANILDGILNDNATEPDQKRLEAFTGMFNAACIDFITVVGQIEGASGGD